MTRGLIITAPASGCGKTTVTLGLLRALGNAGLAVSSAKIGPDYIDPAFHTAASGRPCVTLDSWAMRPDTLARQVELAGRGATLILAEGVMGLFDGAPGGGGSTADLAGITGWPLVMVVDARAMAASAAALVHGFASFRPGPGLDGVIFNRVAGDRHAELLRAACAPLGLPVLGCLPRDDSLRLPERHLGLVQAAEHPDLERFLVQAAALVAAHLDLDALIALARPSRIVAPGQNQYQDQASLPPLGQRIAVAEDTAFGFTYGFVLEGWRRAGAELTGFSPLADQAPDPAADAVFLPGGYPELHAGRLAANQQFLDGLRQAAERGAVVYGECGGYMVLGDWLEDAEGQSHAMAGLLPLRTSFARRRLTLGYREVETLGEGPFGPSGARFRGHEFHYARLLEGEGEAPLFRCRDAGGRDLGPVGSRQGSVLGSFLHLIDRQILPG